jgi:hypothetical protein
VDDRHSPVARDDQARTAVRGQIASDGLDVRLDRGRFRQPTPTARASARAAFPIRDGLSANR